jgi:hypothetical protein
VFCLSAVDEVRWSLPFKHAEWIAGGGLTELGDGQVLAFLYGRISDSGVRVIRLDPTNGREVWQVRCDGLGVAHSIYRHEATLTVEPGRVKVTSRASGGTFVEVLDLGSGRQVSRKRFRADEKVLDELLSRLGQ